MYTLDLSLRSNHELAELSTFLKRLLQRNSNLYPKDRFILAIDSHHRALIAKLMTVCWKLPITLFPIAPELPESYKKRLLQITGTKLLVSELSRFIVNDIQTIDEQQLLGLSSEGLTEDTERLEQYDGEYKDNPIKLIIATSGTTSQPKAVYLSQANILAHFEAAKEEIGLEQSNRWLNILPLYHVGGAMIIYRALLARDRVVLWGPFDVAEVWEAICSEKITHLSLVPIQLEKLLEHQGDLPVPASLKTVIVGGSAISTHLYHQAHQLAWPIHVSYGSSESCSFVAIGNTYYPDYICGQSGHLILSVDMKIVGESKKGLIRIKGPMIMSGYANQNYQLGQGLDDEWLTTSDIGYWDEQKGLIVLGRADRQINSGGEKINPQLLEEELINCPGIQENAITSIEDPSWGESIVIVYAGEWQESQVKQWCQAHLQKQFKPKYFYKVSKLPRNKMGKLNTDALLEVLKQRKKLERSKNFS